MTKSVSQRVVLAGLFTALGLVLPFCTSHIFAVPGTILLPMHIPVLLCGLLCGPMFGALNGLLIPVLSSLLTGMPVVYPMLPIMAVQLCALGLIVGLLYQSRKINIYVSILVGMLVGWGLYGLMYAALMFASGGALQALSVTAALLAGIPGIVIQLILIPTLFTAIQRMRRGNGKSAPAEDKAFNEATRMLKAGEATCIVIKNDTIIHAAEGRGVSPILRLYDNEPDKLKDAWVVDKIIGKAAAMLLVQGGTKKVYGEIMSKSGHDFLQENGIEVSYGLCVDMIAARDGRGICPIEKSVLEIREPQEGIAKIRETIESLMKNAV